MNGKRLESAEKRLLTWLTLLVCTACCSGCGLPLGTFTLGQLWPLVQGEFHIITSARPVQQVINDPNTPPDLRDQLSFAEEVRQFAIDQLGLKAGDSFTTYYDTGSSPVSYTVQASPMDKLEPVLFDYPIAGQVPYSAFFDQASAQAFADQLAQQGDDSIVEEVPDYSTEGLLPDPIVTSFLNQGDIVIADTICHELTHNTVPSSDTDFAESLAVYIGEYGTKLFYQDQRANDPQLLQSVVSYFHDTDLFNTATNNIYNTMNAYYQNQAAAGVDSATIVAGREQVWDQAKQDFMQNVLPQFDNPDDYSGLGDLPLNNAIILSWQRYSTNLDEFDQVRQAVGGDLRDALPVYKAAADSSDPFGYLDNWLLERGVQPQKETPKSRNAETPK